jgi:serine/threonine protein kinase
MSTPTMLIGNLLATELIVLIDLFIITEKKDSCPIFNFRSSEKFREKGKKYASTFQIDSKEEVQAILNILHLKTVPDSMILGNQKRREKITGIVNQFKNVDKGIVIKVWKNFYKLEIVETKHLGLPLSTQEEKEKEKEEGELQSLVRVKRSSEEKLGEDLDKLFPRKNGVDSGIDTGTIEKLGYTLFKKRVAKGSFGQIFLTKDGKNVVKILENTSKKSTGMDDEQMNEVLYQSFLSSNCPYITPIIEAKLFAGTTSTNGSDNKIEKKQKIEGKEYEKESGNSKQKNNEGGGSIGILMPTAYSSLYQLFTEPEQLWNLSRSNPYASTIKELRFIFAKQILKGLHWMHEHNIMMLDLKPQNILVFVNREPEEPSEKKERIVAKLCDFGLAQNVKGGRPRPTNSIVTCNYRDPRLSSAVSTATLATLATVSGNNDGKEEEKKDEEKTWQQPLYGTEVDIWSFGVLLMFIFFEFDVPMTSGNDDQVAAQIFLQQIRPKKDSQFLKDLDLLSSSSSAPSLKKYKDSSEIISLISENDDKVDELLASLWCKALIEHNDDLKKDLPTSFEDIMHNKGFFKYAYYTDEEYKNIWQAIDACLQFDLAGVGQNINNSNRRATTEELLLMSLAGAGPGTTGDRRATTEELLLMPLFNESDGKKEEKEEEKKEEKKLVREKKFDPNNFINNPYYKHLKSTNIKMLPHVENFVLFILHELKSVKIFKKQNRKISLAILNIALKFYNYPPKVFKSNILKFEEKIFKFLPLDFIKNFYVCNVCF